MNEMTKEWMEKQYGDMEFEELPFVKSILAPYKKKIQILEEEKEELIEACVFWEKAYREKKDET
jgi:hypothetical protein